MAKTLRQTHDGTARELEYVTDPDEQLEKKTGTRYGAAELGFRHYWYPALLSRQLGKKPKSVSYLARIWYLCEPTIGPTPFLIDARTGGCYCPKASAGQKAR